MAFIIHLIPWLSLRSNHGLKLANAFGVFITTELRLEIVVHTGFEGCNAGVVEIARAHVFRVCEQNQVMILR